MESNAKQGLVVVVSLLVGAAGGAFVWSQFGEVPRVLAGGDDSASTAGAASARASGGAAMEAELALLRSENERLRHAVGRRAVDRADAPGAREAVEPIDVIAAGGFDAALAAVDWRLIGECHRDMLPLLTRLGEVIMNGEDIPLDVAGALQKLNGNLVAQAGILQQGEVAGVGANGAYTHPAVAGNQILATLEASGMALDDAQRGKLRELMDFYGQQDRNVRIDAGSHEFELETVLAEVDYKKEFFERVKGMLSADQVAALTNETIADRTGLSIYGTSLALAQFARPVPVASADQLVDIWSRRIGDEMKGLDSMQLAQARQLVRGWANGFPDGFWDDKGDALELKGMMRTQRVRDAASRQLLLVRQLLQRFGGDLTPEAREALIKQTGVLVPLPR